MHPYVILKRPGKAIFYLIIIMISFLVKDILGLGLCPKACFGPISKMRLINELAGNHIIVVGNSVVANETEIEKATLYKISSGDSFYLYDKRAEKFICWKKREKKLVAKKYRNNKHAHVMRYNRRFHQSCAFKEILSTCRPTSHVEFVSAYDRSLKMTFNKKGKSQMTAKCNMTECNNQHVRHKAHKVCAKAAAILVSQSREDCNCPEAKSHFCSVELENMKQLKDFCSSVKKS